MYNLSKEQMETIGAHPVVAYFGIKAVSAALGYQVMKREPTVESAGAIERELLDVILNDEDTFFQWVADFIEGRF